MRWSDILIKAKKQNHSVPLGDLSSSARRRLEEIGLDDRDDLICLRLGSLERIWGFLEQGVFHLVWWDPKHQVCPSAKKHT